MDAGGGQIVNEAEAVNAAWDGGGVSPRSRSIYELMGDGIHETLAGGSVLARRLERAIADATKDVEISGTAGGAVSISIDQAVPRPIGTTAYTWSDMIAYPVGAEFNDLTGFRVKMQHDLSAHYGPPGYIPKALFPDQPVRSLEEMRRGGWGHMDQRPVDLFRSDSASRIAELERQRDAATTEASTWADIADDTAARLEATLVRLTDQQRTYEAMVEGARDGRDAAIRGRAEWHDAFLSEVNRHDGTRAEARYWRHRATRRTLGARIWRWLRGRGE